MKHHAWVDFFHELRMMQVSHSRAASERAADRGRPRCTRELAARACSLLERQVARELSLRRREKLSQQLPPSDPCAGACGQNAATPRIGYRGDLPHSHSAQLSLHYLIRFIRSCQLCHDSSK